MLFHEKINRAIIAAGVFWIAGCASSPEMMKLPKPPGGAAESPAPGKAAKAEERIDYVGLQTDMKLDLGIDQLGYREKAFDTCRAGRGFSHSDNCHREYFVLIQFQLLCRPAESDGFTTLTEADTAAISDRSIDWLLMSKNGQVVTDSSGYAQIRMTYPVSPKQKHIKLNSGRKFLHMEVGDITRIVTPPDWCYR